MADDGDAKGSEPTDNVNRDRDRVRMMMAHLPETLGDTPDERVHNVTRVARALLARLNEDDQQEVLYQLVVMSDCVERVVLWPNDPTPTPKIVKN
jgi:hypothetical protein